MNRVLPPASATFAYLGLSVLLTCATLQFSFDRGRLALPPTYDDCGYFESGARWVRTFYESRWRGLSREIYVDPPHSPYSTALAALSFLAFGFQDWAPYAASGWIPFAALVLAHRLLRGAPTAVFILGLGLVLTCPLLTNAVHEFRPDAALGLILATACLVMLAAPGMRPLPGDLLWGSAFFGLSFLIKPVALPLIVVLWCLSLALHLFLRALPAREYWAAILQSALIAFAVAGPHAALAGRRIYNYIITNYLEERRAIWTRSDASIEALLYYVIGDGGLLGRHLVVCVGLAALASGCLVWRKWRLRPTFGLAAVTLAAYLVPTVGRANNPFFAQAFQYLLLFSAVLALRTLGIAAASAGVPRRLLRTVALVPMIGLAILFRWPQVCGPRNADWMLNRREIVAGIYDTIRARARGPSRVLLTTIGDVNPCTLNYFALRDDLPLQFFAGEYLIRPSEMLALCEGADFVVASEAGNELQAHFLPSAGIQDEVLAELNRRPQFEPVFRATFRRSGRGFVVFQRGAVAGRND